MQHEPHGLHVIGGVAPIPARIQVAQAQLARLARGDGRGSGADFAGDEFVAATRRLVVEEHAATGKKTVRFPIVPRQIETRHLADAVRRARVEAGSFDLRNFGHFAEHLARSGEIKAALRRNILDRRQHEMRTVDVRVQCRKLVVE